LLQAFFTDRLRHQRAASPHTLAGYRDAFRLLVQFAAQRLRTSPSTLQVEHLDAPLVGAFLEHLEQTRGNRARTRNARLAAIHSFFRYVALREPAYALHCQRILAMPNKRYERQLIEFLERAEIDALLAAPDPATWSGRRDRTLLTVAIQTGLRVSELIALRWQQVTIGTAAQLRCEGKGRKQRCTPLRRDAAAVLGAWLRAQRGQPQDPVFPSTRGTPLSRDAVERLLAKHVATAQERCPSLQRKQISAHTLRHTAAMELLQNGVDRTVIALWLGHESVETTQMYLQANVRMKEQALARTTPFALKVGRYRPDDKLLAFLEGL
jgi:site-specific recombinase XerD